MPAPVLSILMPTRNRSECARHAIRNILRTQDSRMELVVQDNSDNRSLAEWIRDQQSDPRLRYYQVQERLSISQNFERAIEHAQGTFVCVLGDDDGVSPWIAPLARWMQANQIDAVTSTFPAQYYWPGVRSPNHGSLVVQPFNANMKQTDPERELLKCAKAGGTQLFGLPRVYHGIVRRDCLEAVRQTTGHYAPGVSPDMAASIALASVVKRTCHIDYPMFVPGASPASGAGRGVKKTHHGKLSEESFLDQDFVATWPDGVPAYFSGPTMWGAATIQALSATERTDVLQHFNHNLLHSVCAAFVPQRLPHTLANFRTTLSEHRVSRWLDWTRFAANYLRQHLRRGWRLATRLRTKRFIGSKNYLSNIDNTMISLEEHLATRPLPMLNNPTNRGDSAQLPFPQQRAQHASSVVESAARTG